ncbi:glutathione S-transferase family protein [Rhizobium terrae]|uniref:glutathione S-transferase family protein n=1 Tax=Rhizobium terrae TaxID=2171756 RepID=UPI000E3BD140|nr:glutathione S-transferase family protein [Rhizobium terrae]
MQKPQLFGADYSVYVRAVRLALMEKGVDYGLTPVDVFAPGGPPSSHLVRHPFGRIPAFEHGDFALYETGAITRYVDEAFAGPALQPKDARRRARMNQMIGIADSYVYPILVWGIYVEQASKPSSGRETDAAKLAASLAKAPVCLKAVTDLMGDGPWLCGNELTLADLHLAPMMDYFMKALAAVELMADFPALMEWWEQISARPAMRATIPTS